MLCSRLEKRAATSVVDLWPSPFLRYQQMPIWVTELFFLLCLLFCFCWSSYKFPSNSMRVSFPLSRFPSTGRPAAAATESDRVVHRKKKLPGFYWVLMGYSFVEGGGGRKGIEQLRVFFPPSSLSSSSYRSSDSLSSWRSSSSSCSFLGSLGSLGSSSGCGAGAGHPRRPEGLGHVKVKPGLKKAGQSPRGKQPPAIRLDSRSSTTAR